MRKLLFSIVAATLSTAAVAQVNITKVDKVQPTDEIFIDMAVTAASQAKAAGLSPAGAVVILNGAWKATGTPADDLTPEENAIQKTHRTSLAGGKIYTINQPTVQAMNAIMRAGIDAVYFVNSSADAVAAGIYPAEAYDASGLDTTLRPVPTYQMAYPPAAEIIK